MTTTSRRTTRQSRRPVSVSKPSGTIHPRVQKVGPEHFGIVAVDCAKAKSKFMLTDFYGNIIVSQTVVLHTRPGLDDFVTCVRRAATDHDLRDLIVAVERTGNYHLPVKRAASAAGFEARVVHPLASKQFRLPADPGNKTDDTDLLAIRRAAVNGFGLTEPPLDDVHTQLRLLARHRRDLVRKNASLRNQIHAELDAMLPGLAAAVGDIFAHEPAMVIARRLGSAAAIRERGPAGLVALLRAEHVRYQHRSLTPILEWAATAPEPFDCSEIHHRIFLSLDDERRGRLGSIRAVEIELASLLVRTPYVLLLSFPGLNVVTTAEFAGEMGPISHAPRDESITGRAGLFPSRYQSDEVDHTGPLVLRGNRALRYVLLVIGENLLRCNAHFRTLGRAWREAGVPYRVQTVRAAKRFCRIAYRMVAGGQVYRHPSCRERHYILEKLSIFYCAHDTPMGQVLDGLREAAGWVPGSEAAAEAERLRNRAGLPPAPAASPATATGPAATAARQAAGPRNSDGRRIGPRPLSDILPDVLLRLGVAMVESSASGETDPT